MKQPIVEIEWLDSIGVPAVWEDAVEAEAGSLVPSIITTVGYLWESAENFVTVCQSMSPAQVARRFSIPRGCIVKMRTIRK